MWNWNTTKERLEEDWKMIYITDLVSNHFCLDEHSGLTQLLHVVVRFIAISRSNIYPFPSFSAYLSILSASTLWPSRLHIIRLSPPSLPVPMLHSLCFCLGCLSLCFSPTITTSFSLSFCVFSWAWLDKLAFSLASLYFFRVSVADGPLADDCLSVFWILLLY